ncbi:hypothetical protein TRFO_35590 [Tritrichomonas foetus]|uniref:Uncharacterized protein n=1 Tax=Tritrichomonas foetus TaxID=1144522 RepID=A0A1J4JLB7_9EUKA|nr:hypothetical protein TRFO_35590 [Tritrichomonas foetus]|eukprot:OHS98060.1 hypothetical protein TRFO_35590 [Tritrichomonas foetus]
MGRRSCKSATFHFIHVLDDTGQDIVKYEHPVKFPPIRPDRTADYNKILGRAAGQFTNSDYNDQEVPQSQVQTQVQVHIDSIDGSTFSEAFDGFPHQTSESFTSESIIHQNESRATGNFDNHYLQPPDRDAPVHMNENHHSHPSTVASLSLKSQQRQRSQTDCNTEARPPDIPAEGEDISGNRQFLNHTAASQLKTDPESNSRNESGGPGEGGFGWFGQNQINREIRDINFTDFDHDSNDFYSESQNSAESLQQKCQSDSLQINCVTSPIARIRPNTSSSPDEGVSLCMKESDTVCISSESKRIVDKVFQESDFDEVLSELTPLCL